PGEGEPLFVLPLLNHVADALDVVESVVAKTRPAQTNETPRLQDVPVAEGVELAFHGDDVARRLEGSLGAAERLNHVESALSELSRAYVREVGQPRGLEGQLWGGGMGVVTGGPT